MQKVLLLYNDISLIMVDIILVFPLQGLPQILYTQCFLRKLFLYLSFDFIKKNIKKITHKAKKIFAKRFMDILIIGTVPKKLINHKNKKSFII